MSDDATLRGGGHDALSLQPPVGWDLAGTDVGTEPATAGTAGTAGTAAISAQQRAALDFDRMVQEARLNGPSPHRTSAAFSSSAMSGARGAPLTSPEAVEPDAAHGEAPSNVASPAAPAAGAQAPAEKPLIVEIDDERGFGGHVAKLKAAVGRGRAWYEQRGPREQRVIAMCTWLLSLNLAYTMVLDPAMGKFNAALKRSRAAALAPSQAAGTLSQTRTTIEARHAAARAEIASINARRKAHDDFIEASGGALMSPQQASATLRALVTSRPDVRLVEIRTSAPRALVLAPAAGAASAAVPARSALNPRRTADEAQVASVMADVHAVKPRASAPQPAASAASAVPALYEHPIEVAVQGSYAAVVAFADSLRELQGPLIWDGLHMSVAAHPQVVLILRLHTLSRQAEWLVAPDAAASAVAVASAAAAPPPAAEPARAQR